MTAPLIDRLERWSLLIAESAGLTWRTDSARAIEIEKELIAVQAGERFFATKGVEPLHPLYQSIDDGELSGGFFRAMPSDLDQAAAILDLLAARIVEGSEVAIGIHGGPVVWRTTLHFFGAGVVAPCFATLRPAMASLRLTYARLEAQRNDGAIEAASIGTDDAYFEEADIVACDGGDEHGTLIARLDIDEEPLAPSMELVKVRSRAALRALRGAA